MLLTNLDLSHPLVWTVDGALTPAECAEMIARMEALGPEEAPISGVAGAQIRKEIRDNGRVIIDDPAFAARLFARVQAQVPVTLQGMRVAGANERLRCYRYLPGQRFGLHHDGSFVRSPQERSLLTLMVYLNDDFDGGATDFPELRKTVTPQTGMALLFQHMVLHEGSVVTRGAKYAVRSDVMYCAQ